MRWRGTPRRSNGTERTERTDDGDGDDDDGGTTTLRWTLDGEECASNDDEDEDEDDETNVREGYRK